MPLSAHAKDAFVAPNMSQFVTAQIDDLSSYNPEQEHWVANYILNSMFGSGGVPQARRQYVFHLLRRSEAAFRTYAEARDYTLRYIRNREALTTYLAAILYWENLLMHSYIAFQQLRYLSEAMELFQKGDGSILERLNRLYNLSKHANESQFPQDGTLAIWLENNGLRSTDARLAFSEISREVLPELASWADLFVEPATTSRSFSNESQANKTAIHDLRKVRRLMGGCPPPVVT